LIASVAELRPQVPVIVIAKRASGPTPCWMRLRITAINPDKRIVAMLGARSRGKTVAKASATETEIKQPT